MSLRSKFFAMTYDRQIAGAEKAGLRAFRERLLAGASGDVIEIGGGTGLNLSCYGPAVRSLTITEPEPAMLRRLERAVSAHHSSARVLRAPAEDLPFDDDSFDVAVSTLVLCGVDDQPRALRELGRADLAVAHQFGLGGGVEQREFLVHTLILTWKRVHSPKTTRSSQTRSLSSMPSMSRPGG